jgi:hypothetical protein
MAITNTHEIDIISQIRLPDGKTYEIHDPNAIHDIADLNLSSVLKFKGVKETYEDLRDMQGEDGDVWLIQSGEARGLEYVWVSELNKWEPLGNVHDAASSTHTHTATVTGTNSQSDLIGSVNVPTVTVQRKYIDASAETPTLSKTKVLGANTSFSITGGNAITTKLIATSSDVAVDGDGTASAITGFDDHTTANVINGLTKETITSASSSDVTIPNVTGNTSVTASKVSVDEGTAPSWSASVSGGVLSFSFIEGTVPPIITATDVSASKVTLGTAITASKVTTSEKQVVTGGTYKNVIEELGNPYTTEVLTGVKVTAQPTIKLRSGTSGDVSVATGVSTFNISPVADEVEVVTNVTLGKISLALHDAETQGSQRIVSNVETDLTSVSFNKGSYAKPQTWKQDSGTTGTPNN